MAAVSPAPSTDPWCFAHKHRQERDCAIISRGTNFHLLAKPTVPRVQSRFFFFLYEGPAVPGSRFRMADELLETCVRQLLESRPAPEVQIGWQGGEPTLMGLDFFKRTVDYAERYKRPADSLHHPDQRYADGREWARVLQGAQVPRRAERGGPRELHDAYRVDKGGQGSFDSVMRGWNGLLKRNGL